MTDNLPAFADGRTVFVSPFDGGQDISPHDGRNGRFSWYTILHNQSLRVSLRNTVRGVHTFVPPSDRMLDAYHRRGMADAKRFHVSEGYYDWWYLLVFTFLSCTVSSLQKTVFLVCCQIVFMLVVFCGIQLKISASSPYELNTDIRKHRFSWYYVVVIICLQVH